MAYTGYNARFSWEGPPSPSEAAFEQVDFSCPGCNRRFRIPYMPGRPHDSKLPCECGALLHAHIDSRGFSLAATLRGEAYALCFDNLKRSVATPRKEERTPAMVNIQLSHEQVVEAIAPYVRSLFEQKGLAALARICHEKLRQESEPTYPPVPLMLIKTGIDIIRRSGRYENEALGSINDAAASAASTYYAALLRDVAKLADRFADHLATEIETELMQQQRGASLDESVMDFGPSPLKPASLGYTEIARLERDFKAKMRERSLYRRLSCLVEAGSPTGMLSYIDPLTSIWEDEETFGPSPMLQQNADGSFSLPKELSPAVERLRVMGMTPPVEQVEREVDCTNADGLGFADENAPPVVHLLKSPGNMMCGTNDVAALSHFTDQFADVTCKECRSRVF